jgi:hypothetical protein
MPFLSFWFCHRVASQFVKLKFYGRKAEIYIKQNIFFLCCVYISLGDWFFFSCYVSKLFFLAQKLRFFILKVFFFHFSLLPVLHKFYCDHNDLHKFWVRLTKYFNTYGIVKFNVQLNNFNPFNTDTHLTISEC